MFFLILFLFFVIFAIAQFRYFFAYIFPIFLYYNYKYDNFSFPSSQGFRSSMFEKKSLSFYSKFSNNNFFSSKSITSGFLAKDIPLFCSSLFLGGRGSYFYHFLSLPSGPVYFFCSTSSFHNSLIFSYPILVLPLSSRSTAVFKPVILFFNFKLFVC